MNSILLGFALLFVQIPKHSPAGVWVAESGSRYEFRVDGDGKDVHVKLVPGSNPKFLEYEINATVQEEINTYKGVGYFVAKMEGGKECKFPTEWTFVVVTDDRIIGVASNILADQKTCEIKENNQIQLDLKKKN